MILRATRVLGALAILAVGAVHLQQYLGADYAAVPTIGPLFLANAIGSGIVGVALLLPLERLLAAPKAHVALAGLAMGAVAIAIGSLVALFVSESGSLFGFSETGYRAVIVIAIGAETATVMLLGPVAAVSITRAVACRREASSRRRNARGSRLDYHAAR